MTEYIVNTFGVLISVCVTAPVWCNYFNINFKHVYYALLYSIVSYFIVTALQFCKLSKRTPISHQLLVLHFNLICLCLTAL